MKNYIFISLMSMLFFNTISSCKKDDNPLTDSDGNVYTSVKIGTQVWMVENLKTTKYRNGDLIGTTTPATLDITAESAPKYQWAYMGDESKVADYGRLYTWNAITDTRGVCPTGWHVPSDADWTTLITSQGGEDVAQDKLKEAGATHWQYLNDGATNSSGFTALPGGKRLMDGSFYDAGMFGNWWSSTEDFQSFAYLLSMSSFPSPVFRVKANGKLGNSVRCLQD
jgi:uncharacterized protein (TIGR02145 family)